jgi:polygalacturonase
MLLSHLALATFARVSSAKECNIVEYGADASAANNTAAIQKAIAACASGGTVTISGGDFKTGPLVVSGATNLAGRTTGPSRAARRWQRRSGAPSTASAPIVPAA